MPPLIPTRMCFWIVFTVLSIVPIAAIVSIVSIGFFLLQRFVFVAAFVDKVALKELLGGD